ncbi:unnamed protein product [Rhizoctonia solani]|uniref:Uncharacterized protein n=1 Tax=Rhizoctonia solani TaxID=456999 RepID=A0A8H2WCT6_9AGAM|nr:unnamed protein product [Rhizoctonia solani]
MDSAEPIRGSSTLFDHPWGEDDKIVVAIDLGTTQSGMAFTFLQNGVEFVIHRVTRWPGQECQMTQSKIPTLVWYDSNMEAVSFGAEALSPEIQEKAEDNDWALAKHFKLHLFPENIKARHIMNLDPLPLGVSLLQIYTDYLSYLLKHTRLYFQDRIVDGRSIWERYSPTIDIIITHPNGWGVREQTFLRKSAVEAGYASLNDAPTKIHFLSEAEASVYFCLYHTNLWSRINDDTTFLVCDAGGATADIAVFTVVSKHPVPTLVETKPSVSIGAGAVFINHALEQYLHRLLSTSGLSQEDVLEYTKQGVSDFEQSAKRHFEDENREYSIQLTGFRFNNSSIGVRRGLLRLPGSEIKSIFDVCVPKILMAVDEQIRGLSIPYILLVGGFGDSPYLRREFQRHYEPRGCQISLVNDSTSKAVADGAILWKFAQRPQARTSRFSWGIETSITLDPDDPDHQNRKDMSSALGWKVVSGRWKCLLRKGTVLDKNVVVKTPFSLDYGSSSDEPGQLMLDIFGYSGDDEPVWMRNKQGELLPNFHRVVNAQMNLKNLRGALESKIALDASLQWHLDFDVCMQFDHTHLETYLEWKEKGTVRTGLRVSVPILDMP